ncbi:MAG: universal stress protein [Desulfomonilia bacterium]
MFDKILYPTDFSDVAGKGLDFVERLQEAGTREVVILHVIDHHKFEILAVHDSEFRAKEIEESIEKMSLEKMNQIADRLKNKGMNVKIRLEKGTPFCEILRVADEENVSAIVVGSHGISNVAEMLLGSVSEKVIRKSKKTVLVVKR